MPISVNPVNFDFGQETQGFATSTIVAITNTGISPVLITGIVLTGTGIAQFAIVGLLMPVYLFPQQKVSFSVYFWAHDAGRYSATATVNASDGTSAQVTLAGGPNVARGIGANDSNLIFTPSINAFPPQLIGAVGQTILITGTNVGPGTVNVTGDTADPQGLVTFSNFSHAFPIPLVTNASFTFDVIWNKPPGVVAQNFYQDNINTLLTTANMSGGASDYGDLIMAGFMIDFIPINPLVGNNPVLWIGAGTRLLQPDSLSLICEEGCTITRQYDVSIPLYEKTIARWAVRYENYGVATITLTLTSERGQTNGPFSLQIGDNTADGKVRTAYFDINISAEIITATLIVNSGGGPVSIVDMYPEFETEGEYVENT